MRKFGQIDGRAVGKLIGRFMQAVTANHPLGRHAHVLREHLLQRALAQGRAFGQIAHLGQTRVLLQHLQDGVDALDLRVGRRQHAQQQGFCRSHHARVILCAQHDLFGLHIVAIKQRGDWQNLVGQQLQGLAEERTKGAGPKAQADHATRLGQRGLEGA